MTFVKADKGTTNNKNDKCMTPPDIAEMLIGLLPIKRGQTLLDPFKGKGAFYNHFPDGTIVSWCEIDEGSDFFACQAKFDWLISNPPYSIFDAVLDHSFEIANNVAYLVPLSKIFSSMGRIRKWQAYGNIKAIWILSASKCGFPFGFPAAFVWWQKGYKGETKITTLDKGGDNE